MAQSSRNRIISRFTEVDAPPNNAPLSNEYQSEPLVSLEDSLRNLFSAIQDLDKYILEAKNKCYYSNDYNLSHDESAAIYIYTIEWRPSSQESLYILFNRDLRSKDRSKTRPWLTYLRLFMVALAKLPSITISVWRGLKEDVSGDFKQGKRFTWRSATSCSRDANQAIGSFTNVNGKSTIFRIDTTNGKDISAYSETKLKKEVSGHKFSPVIYLEEI